MINEENKEMIFRTILAGILLLAVLLMGLYFIFNIKKDNTDNEFHEPIIPPITEDYETTTLSNYKSYDGQVTLNKNNEIILSSNDENISYYVIGKYGSIFNSMLPNYAQKDKTVYGNYEIIYNDDNAFYIDKKNNIISENYDNIIPIKTYDNYSHLILYKDKNYYILNLNNNEIYQLDSVIKNIYYKSDIDNSDSSFINNNKYLVVSNYDGKYGLIDYNGNIIINFKYDYLNTYIDENTFIVKISNKYGLIDNNDKVICELNNDNIFYYNDLEKYSIFIKDKKMGIYYKDKLVVNYKIDYKYDNNFAFNYIVNNGILYLNVLNDNKMISYIINDDGIINTSNYTYEPLFDENNKLKFFYIITEENNQNIITYYDLDYNELYSISISSKNDISVILIENNISIIHTDNDLYYIDLFNSKKIAEKDAINEYFDNGYSYTLNANKKLIIYKNNEVISTYDNINMYLGNYYFLSTNYDEDNDSYYTIIYNLEFIENNK